MTEEQYWEKDCTLVIYYRKAEEIRIEKLNQLSWLQGRYFYDALIRISPILHAFAKKGTKAAPYLKEAYPIGQKATEQTEKNNQNEKFAKGKRYMEAYMVGVNKQFEQRK